MDPSVPSAALRMDNVPFSGIRKILNKAAGLERSGVDAIHLEVGRPDFDTPGHNKQAPIDELSNDMVYYTSNFGIPRLREG